MSLQNPTYWDGEFRKKITKHHKICICTNVMDRLGDISQTLPDNIDALKSYPNIEFTLLNYGDKSGVDGWVKSHMIEHIKSGVLKYYKILDNIEFYSMAHSRNVCLRLAGGLLNRSHNIIVNQVDADNFLRHNDPSHQNFAEYVNMLAHEIPSKAIFGKGRKLMHGRIGFYKDEFCALGGYDEGLMGYGHDDRDLYNRALEMDFTLAWYGSQFVERNKTSKEVKTANMANKNWKETENINKEISDKNLSNGVLVANHGYVWGKANVLLNFKQRLSIPFRRSLVKLMKK